MGPVTGNVNLSVLIVEDEPLTLDLLMETLALKYPSASVFQAADGKAALELFLAHRPEIVITDMNMPRMTGSQLATAIREVAPGAKIIAVTGERGDTGNQAAVRREGLFDYCLMKPILITDLLNILETSCRG
ncbi:response regulator transcription factor [Geomesophilobacter sediminis]|uniref:Response regulator n=1 Tax=Geomesophilobacter sediminis TaxID=2798584 RepID=A0A8J7M1N1_9BACT|nr:response regulator [Geomesophilobacter sediminis]MBJ6726834.1 response regulator [Geomesophilobacter sediminis]